MNGSESVTEAVSHSESGRPLVSVITAVRNGAAHIAQTLESVIAQDYPYVEHIVIDGGSTDGTQDIVARYRDRIAHFVSEPDRGLADAWNKGVRLSRGQYIAFLNSDDYYLPGFLSSSVAASIGSKREVIYGAIQVLGTNDMPLRIVDGTFDATRIAFGFCFRHPECLVHRALFEQVGLFDERVRIAVDADFMLRCLRAGAIFRKSRGAVCMRRGGMSDRHWTRTTIEYLSRAEAHGFLSARRALVHRYLVPLRVLNRSLGLMPALRAAKARAMTMTLKWCQWIHGWAPWSLRVKVYRLCGYRVDESARIAPDVQLACFGRLCVEPSARIGGGVKLDNRGVIRIGKEAIVEEGAVILSNAVDESDVLRRARLAEVVIGEGARIGVGALIMPGARVPPASRIAGGSLVDPVG